ncbi:MAG: CHAT domain-containing protein [Promethearchaeota archaeon]
MNLAEEDSKFVNKMVANFAVCSLEEFYDLTRELSTITVQAPILKKLKGLLEDTLSSIEEREGALANENLLNAWREYISQISSSELPEIEIFVLYLWNFQQIKGLEQIPPSDPLFQSTSLAIVEKALDNLHIAKKFECIYTEANYFDYIGDVYYSLFMHGQKNKSYLEEALNHLKQAVPLWENLKNFKRLLNTYGLISVVLKTLAEFYIDINPKKFEELIVNSSKLMLTAVEIAREKSLSELPGTLLDASGTLSEVGRIQKDEQKARPYLEQAITLAKEGLKKVEPKHEAVNELKEGLYNNLGIAYSFLADITPNLPEKQKNFKISLNNKLKGLEHAKKTGMKSLIIRNLLNIGQAYHKMALIERKNSKNYKELLNKAIEYINDALKMGEQIEVDPLSERHLLSAGEVLSNIYTNILVLEKDRDKNLNWLSKKLEIDRKNIELAKKWKINPRRIAENCITAENGIREIINKIDDIMIIRKLLRESIDLLVEASKNFEKIKVDKLSLINSYRKICNSSQELSRIQPDAKEKYEILLYGKNYGEKALELAITLDKPFILIAICDNYGLLVHDIGHATEISDIEKAKEFFKESIEIFQKGLELAKEHPDTIMSRAVLLDYIGGSYRDLANLASDTKIMKNYFLKSVDVKEKSLELFEQTKDPYETAVAADSLTISLQNLASVEDDPNKVIEIYSKAIKYNTQAEELFIQTHKFSAANRCRLSRINEIKPRFYLTSGSIEQDTKKRWEYVLKARESLQEGFEQSKVSPIYRSLAEYFLWEYPQPIQNGVDAGGVKIIWNANQGELEIFNKSYKRSVQIKLALLMPNKKIPISDVKFEVSIEPVKLGIMKVNPIIKIVFENNKMIYLKVITRLGVQMLEKKGFEIINPTSESFTLQLITNTARLTSTESAVTIIGERNIFIVNKKPSKIQDKIAEIELSANEVLNCLYQITILPKFSGILCITNPGIKNWKYNLTACLLEGPLTYKDAPHIVETDFSPIIFMDEKGNIPTKFFNVEEVASGSLVEFNTQYPAIIRKILIFGEIFKEKSPYDRMLLLNILKEQITNMATVNDPNAGITIITSDPTYYDEMFPLIERDKEALAQHIDFISLSQVAKLLEIYYMPEEETLSRLGNYMTFIRSLSFDTIFLCDDPIMAFLCVPYCRFLDSIVLTSAECRTEIGEKTFKNATRVFIVGKLSEKFDFKGKEIVQLGKDLITLTNDIHNQLKEQVDKNWENFMQSEYRALFPELRKELFGDSIIITSKQAEDLSYLILASSYAAAKLSSILLIDRDKKKMKLEADLFKQMDFLTHKSAGTRSHRAPEKVSEHDSLINRLYAFAKDLRKKYFDERYIPLIDKAKFISIISDIPLPFELMQYGEGNSFLSLEKAMGRLCSTDIEETSILIQFSILQAMMQTSDVKKATIIAPQYYGAYSLNFAVEEAKREALLLSQKRNLGKENVEAIIAAKITRRQFNDQLKKNPWLFVHYVGHGDLINRESCFMVQPSEYTDLVPIKAEDLPVHIAGQPVFIASSCLSGRYSEGSEGLSGLVFEIIKRGAICFIGTLWEVYDLTASKFIAELYIELLDGKFIGNAIQKSRKTIIDQKDPTYGAFILFGDPMVRIR